MDRTLDKGHTPGPWHVRTDGSIGSVQRGGMVVATPCIEPKNQGDQAANARLIAAAPVLLETLERLDRAGQCKGFTRLCEADAHAVKTAIAKATSG